MLFAPYLPAIQVIPHKDLLHSSELVKKKVYSVYINNIILKCLIMA